MLPRPVDDSDGPLPDPSETVAVVVVTDTATLAQDFVETVRAATSRDLDLVHVTSAPSSVADAAHDMRTVDVQPASPYAAAVNAGVHATTAEFVVVASPAVRWQPGSLDQLLAAARRWPTGASFGPLICRPDGSAYPSARAVPTLGRGIGHALFAHWWPSNPWTAGYRNESDAPIERTTGWLSGSCLLVRRDAFDVVGGFDDRFVAYFEDVDLGERLGRAGWHNVYVPTAVVQHTGVEVTGRESASMAVEHHRSAWRYLSQRYRGLRWLPLRVVLRIGLAIRSRLSRRA